MELENQLVKLTSAGVSSVPLRFRYSKAKSGVSQADSTNAPLSPIRGEGKCKD